MFLENKIILLLSVILSTTYTRAFPNFRFFSLESYSIYHSKNSSYRKKQKICNNAKYGEYQENRGIERIQLRHKFDTVRREKKFSINKLFVQ